MAQDVVIGGTEYHSVPRVDIPTAGGGTASFVDTSGDTVTADKLLSGYTAHTAQGEPITGEIPDNGAISATLDGYDTTSYTVAAGYTTGGTIRISAETVLTLASLSSIMEALIVL